MKLRFYGRLRDAVGNGEIDRAVPAGIADSEALRHWLGAEFPALLEPSVRIAIDGRIAAGPMPIRGDGTADFLPPMSGG